MKIEIIEKCEIDSDEKIGIRIVIYKSAKNNLKDALEDYEKKFDSDNICNSYDEFDGECLDSEVVGISILA
ncbi:UNVERIFIED_ORG: hypothetical protein B2H93_04815 [Clostridium botulinum]